MAAAAMPAHVKSNALELRRTAKSAGGLVGVKAAAEMLGIATPNFKRYRDRLTAIPVEGSADVFAKAEVRALARVLEAERAKRGV